MTMRILLVHNPKAGSKQWSKEQLMKALVRAGHQPIYRSSKKKGWRKGFKAKLDLVLIAGGDGTVGKVAQKLVRRKLPLAILPLGTANNVARTLGFDGPFEKLIGQ